MMLVKDGADHARLRTLVNKAFTPRVVAELRPRVQAIADELLDAAARRGELDAIEDLGMPLPIIVIAELLGVPLEDRAHLKRWSDALVTFLDGTIRERGLAEAARACVEMRAYMDRLFAERRARPRDDLISRLIAAREVEDRLSDDELFAHRGADARRGPRDHDEPDRQRPLHASASPGASSRSCARGPS